MKIPDLPNITLPEMLARMHRADAEMQKLVCQHPDGRPYAMVLFVLGEDATRAHLDAIEHLEAEA